jgi:lipoic acid synthetase
MSNNNIEIAEEPRFKPRPDWLSVKLPMGEEYKKVREIVSTHKF